MAVTIKFKRADKDVWTKLNLVLQPGEPGFELDTGKLKIGNGKTPWNDLSYLNGEATLSPDGETLVLNSDNVLTIFGYPEALEGQIPIKTKNGISWFTLSEVAKSGDIKDLKQTEVIEFYGGSAQNDGGGL